MKTYPLIEKYLPEIRIQDGSYSEGKAYVKTQVVDVINLEAALAKGMRVTRYADSTWYPKCSDPGHKEEALSGKVGG